jgi:hypothetical protein
MESRVKIYLRSWVNKTVSDQIFEKLTHARKIVIESYT